MRIESYLTFGGNCEEAMCFYQSILGGDFTTMMRFSEAPPEAFTVPDAFKDKVMHCTLVTEGCSLMASDTIELDKLTIGSNYSISVSIPDDSKANTVFNGLSEGGHTVMPYTDAFWGGKFGMLVDKFGTQWMVSGGYEPH